MEASSLSLSCRERSVSGRSRSPDGVHHTAPGPTCGWRWGQLGVGGVSFRSAEFLYPGFDLFPTKSLILPSLNRRGLLFYKYLYFFFSYLQNERQDDGQLTIYIIKFLFWFSAGCF